MSIDTKEANERLERFFEPLLRDITKGDFESYARATGILEKWLSTNPETHHPAVRVEIIRALFVTQARARGEVNFRYGFDVTFKALQYHDNPFVEEYIKLVKTVERLEGIFAAEVKGLRDGFQAILATTCRGDSPPLKTEELARSRSSSRTPGSSTSRQPVTNKPKRKVDIDALIKADEEDFLRKQTLAAQSQALGSESHTQPPLPAFTQSAQVVTNSGTSELVHVGQETEAEVVIQPGETAHPVTVVSSCRVGTPSGAQLIGDHENNKVNSWVTDAEMNSEPVRNEVEVGTESVIEQGIFGPEMSVIARQLGLDVTFHISIEFEITQPQYDMLKKWNCQRGTAAFTDLQTTSICITLGCYLLADLKEIYENCPTLSSFERQVACAPAKWPDRPGGLGIKVLSSESENIPLSPPFHASPDNLVDISNLLVLGRNRLELRQEGDLRQYIYILHAHHPTRRQMQEIQDQRQRTKEWQEFIDNLGAPFATDAFASRSLDRYLRS